MIDELEHIRLLHFDRQTALADYHSFRDVNHAWAETVAGYTRLRQRYEKLGSPLIATHVFPVLLHAAARAGCTPCPAGYDLLKGIPLIFLTGPEIDDATVAAMRRCVAEGATCVVWATLAKRLGIGNWTSGVATMPDGNGRWIITDDFGLSQIQEAIWPHIGRPDEIKYRFGDRTVILRRVTEDEVSVEGTALYSERYRPVPSVSSVVSYLPAGPRITRIVEAVLPSAIPFASLSFAPIRVIRVIRG